MNSNKPKTIFCDLDGTLTKHPKDVGLIQNPDYELRYNIVKAKIYELKLNHSISLDLSEEIKKFISSEIRTSVRELVGALNRIISFSKNFAKS